MKIATYNIWNSNRGMPHSTSFIIREITNAGADLVCLQEVPCLQTAEIIASQAGYPHCFFAPIRGEEEGLCILSRMPFAECRSWTEDANAICAAILCSGQKITVIDLHLPWDSTVERERQIVRITEHAAELRSDFIYMAGDFNCSDTADVQRFLTGECLLQGTEANPRWYDLALSHGEMTETLPECTLDFRKNPRFAGNTIETNARYDRILLRNPYPRDFPILQGCSIFGRTVYNEIGLAASDHYGVIIEMESSAEIT